MKPDRRKLRREARRIAKQAIEEARGHGISRGAGAAYVDGVFVGTVSRVAFLRPPKLK